MKEETMLPTRSQTTVDDVRKSRAGFRHAISRRATNGPTSAATSFGSSKSPEGSKSSNRLRTKTSKKCSRIRDLLQLHPLTETEQVSALPAPDVSAPIAGTGVSKHRTCRHVPAATTCAFDVRIGDLLLHHYSGDR